MKQNLLTNLFGFTAAVIALLSFLYDNLKLPKLVISFMVLLLIGLILAILFPYLKGWYLFFRKMRLKNKLKKITEIDFNSLVNKFIEFTDERRTDSILYFARETMQKSINHHLLLELEHPYAISINVQAGKIKNRNYRNYITKIRDFLSIVNDYHFLCKFGEKNLKQIMEKDSTSTDKCNEIKKEWLILLSKNNRYFEDIHAFSLNVNDCLQGLNESAVFTKNYEPIRELY